MSVNGSMTRASLVCSISRCRYMQARLRPTDAARRTRGTLNNVYVAGAACQQVPTCRALALLAYSQIEAPRYRLDINLYISADVRAGLRRTGRAGCDACRNPQSNVNCFLQCLGEGHHRGMQALAALPPRCLWLRGAANCNGASAAPSPCGHHSHLG